MEQSHLIRFDPFTDNAITADNVMTLPTAEGACAFSFEESEGQLLMVLLPDGTLSVYDVKSAWNLVVSEQVIPDMPNCTDVTMVSGYGQAFIMTGWNNKVYGINLMHILHTNGELEVSETTLTFKPYSAVVAGVPDEAMCHISDHEHEEEGTEEDMAEAASGAVGNPQAAAVSVLGLLLTAMAMAMMMGYN